MFKKTKAVFSVLIILITFMTFSLNVFAGNNDSRPSDIYIGQAPEDWSITARFHGIRVSIYWAPSVEEFVRGEGVIPIGNTTDITKTGPRHEVEVYTPFSIFDYMNRDNENRGNDYDSVYSAVCKYNTKGLGEVFRKDKKDIVALMPHVLEGTKEEWDNWFEGGKDGDPKDYRNIPAISRLCGHEISAKDFKKGILRRGDFGSEPGVYKIFFEPILYPEVDGVNMVMTLRDMIRWQEAFERGNITTTKDREMLTQIAPAFVYTANAQFLIGPEAVICMEANDPVYQAWYDPKTNAERQAAWAELRKQIAKGGRIYKSMGVGVITPREPAADFDIIYNSEIVTDKLASTFAEPSDENLVELCHMLKDQDYKAEEITKVEYYILPDNAVSKDIIEIDLSKPDLTVTDFKSLPKINVSSAFSPGEKTVIGMRMHFDDGTVFPEGKGDKYGDHLVIHHVTLVSEGQPATELTSTFVGHIRADDRDNEKFDVSQGIPTSETLYTNVLADEYVYNFIPEQVTGSVEYKVKVTYTSNDGDEITRRFRISKNYSYWEIRELDVYGITESTLNNKSLPGETITLTPGPGYKAPEVHYVDTSDHLYEGDLYVETTCSSPDYNAMYAAAVRAAPTPMVRNDGLAINGRTVLDTALTASHGRAPDYANLKAPVTDRDILYQNNLRIIDELPNGLYDSTGTITYERVFTLNPDSDMEQIRTLDVNSVFVHTPVHIDINVSDDDAHNQKVAPEPDTCTLVLDRPFTVDISNTGMHRNIRGYGNRNYTKYIKDRIVRFPFDVYLGTGRTGKYLKANTWHSLKALGVGNDATKLTFYPPSWVDEGLYEIEFRTLALNDHSDGQNIQTKANLDHEYTVAAVKERVEVTGRIYDLKITDIDDVSWELFFRKQQGKIDPTGKEFYPGPNNIDGVRDNNRNYFFPVMPGKNDVTGFKNRAVKLGYAFKFELKTIGNYYDRYDFIQIMPTFTYVDKNGQNRTEVDLYYSTPENALVRIGSGQDTLIHSMKLNFKYRGIDPAEFTRTAEAMYHLRGGIGDYTLEEWMDSFPKVSQTGSPYARYWRIRIGEPFRSFIGPDSKLPQEVNPYKALASVQKWYGEYRLPVDCLAVPKGTDLSKMQNLKRSSPVFLKDGYIIVNFRDISVINDDDFENPILKYAGQYANGWQLEGYDINQGGWQLLEGDILVYYIDRRASDDFTGAGTH